MNLSAFRPRKLQGFRCRTASAVRPITLIYGANSAGKSSVLHALALAHHAIESGIWTRKELG